MKHILPFVVVLCLCSLPANAESVPSSHRNDGPADATPHRYPAGSELPMPIRHVADPATAHQLSSAHDHHRPTAPPRSEKKNKQPPKFISKFMEMERKKNAWLKKTFGL